MTSNGILPILRIPNRQNLQPELYRTELSVQKIPACEQLPETDASTEGERLRRPGKQPRCGKPGTGIETARSEKFGFGDMAEMDVSLLVRLSSGFSGGLSGHLFLRCVRAAPSVLWKTAADNPPSINSHAISGTLHEDCGASVPYLSGRDGAVCAVAVVFYECGIFSVSVPDESAAGTAMALRCFVGVLDPESVSDGLFFCHDEGCALWCIFPAGI